MQIRKATLNDIDFILDSLFQISSFENSLEPNIDPNWVYSWNYKEEYLKNIEKEDECILIAEKEGENIWIVAWYLEKPTLWWTYEKISFLDTLFIDEQYRWNGYAQQLCKEFENWAKSQWSKRMHIKLLHNNKNALNLYEKLWFQPHIFQLWKNL